MLRPSSNASGRASHSHNIGGRRRVPQGGNTTFVKKAEIGSFLNAKLARGSCNDPEERPKASPIMPRRDPWKIPLRLGSQEPGVADSRRVLLPKGSVPRPAAGSVPPILAPDERSPDSGEASSGSNERSPDSGEASSKPDERSAEAGEASSEAGDVPRSSGKLHRVRMNVRPARTTRIARTRSVAASGGSCRRESREAAAPLPRTRPRGDSPLSPEQKY